MAKKTKAELEAQFEKEIASLPMAARIRARTMRNSIEKFGEDSVITGDHLDDGLKFVPEPDLLIQARLKRPGYALGRIKTTIGYEGSSKTSKLYREAELFLRCGGVVDIVTIERAESTEHLRHYADPKLITFHRADTLEDAIKRTLSILDGYEKEDPNNEIPHYLGLDSVAAAVVDKMLEEETEAGAKQPGGYGKIMKDFVNIMIQRASQTQTYWHVLNQARDKQAMDRMAAMAMQWQPQIEKMGGPGGRALPFASTYFDVLEKTSRVKDDDKLVQGFGVKCTMKKNKLGSPEGIFEYLVTWGKQFDFADNTMEVLGVGGILGLQVKDKRYWCPQAGVKEKDKMPADEMYQVIHSPENMPKFQEALGVIPGDVYPQIYPAWDPTKKAATPPPPAPTEEMADPSAQG